MLQLVIENAAAVAVLIGATAGAIATVAGAIAKISDAVVKVAPLLSGKVNRRARRLERAKHGLR